MNTLTRSIAVVVVDDHGMVRRGVRGVLEASPGTDVVGEARSGRHAIALARERPFDVAVLDLSLPDMNGFELMSELRRIQPAARFLMLTMHDDPGTIRSCFEAGAHGFMTKDADPDDLVHAVQAVAAGQRYVHPSLGALLARADVARQELTPREREVALLVARGLTSRQVAQRLFLSVRTVETHRARIMRKLGLGSRAALVEWAMDAGLLSRGIEE